MCFELPSLSTASLRTQYFNSITVSSAKIPFPYIWRESLSAGNCYALRWSEHSSYKTGCSPGSPGESAHGLRRKMKRLNLTVHSLTIELTIRSISLSIISPSASDCGERRYAFPMSRL